MNVLKVVTPSRIQVRGLLRPPPNRPYFGLYRTQGESVRQDDLLVSQKRLNYHPGANVYHVNDRGCNLLKADCDGTVMITREKVDVDLENPAMKVQYGHRNIENIYKMTYNIVPLKMSNRFRLLQDS